MTHRPALFDQYHNHLIALPEGDYPHWQGIFIQKNPLDLWNYAEIIQKVAPDVIIETGTYKGGSALFFSDIQQTVNPSGIVISIDQANKHNSQNIMSSRVPSELEKIDCNRITFLQGYSQDTTIIEEVRSLIIPGMTIMVSLDAGHTAEEVVTE